VRLSHIINKILCNCVIIEATLNTSMMMLMIMMIKSTSTHPGCGPLSVRSNTCRGLSSHCSLCINREPWFPPLRGFTNTSRGREPGLGTGFTTNGRVPAAAVPADRETTESSPLDRLDSRRLEPAERRRLRTDDLNKPCT